MGFIFDPKDKGENILLGSPRLKVRSVALRGWCRKCKVTHKIVMFYSLVCCVLCVVCCVLRWSGMWCCKYSNISLSSMTSSFLISFLRSFLPTYLLFCLLSHLFVTHYFLHILITLPTIRTLIAMTQHCNLSITSYLKNQYGLNYMKWYQPLKSSRSLRHGRGSMITIP